MPSEQDGFKDTDIGPIPVEWEVVPLGKISTLQRGKDLPKRKRVLGPFPVIGSSGILGYHSEFVAQGPGVLVGRSGSVGKATWVDGDYWPLNTTLWVKNFHGNDRRFVYYLLSHFDFSRYTAGASVPTLNRNLVHPVKVGLPPLPEQRRIAHVLSTIQRAIAAQDDLIAAAKETKRSLMHRLFTYGPGAEPAATKETEIGEIPAQWDLCSLGSLLAAKLRNGIYKPRTSYGKGQIRIIQLNDIYVPDARIQSHLLDTVEVTEVEAETYRVLGGDLIINRVSKREEGVGAVALVESSDLSIVFESNMFRVRLDRSRISTEYFLQYGQSDLYRRQVMLRATKANQTSINQGSLQSVPVPIPKFSTQLATAGILSVADRKIAAEEQRKAALQALFQSMLEQLMMGRVRVDGGVQD